MSKPKILYFTATWCGVCKTQKPILEQYVTQRNLDLEVVDVDERPELAKKYGILKLPSIVSLVNDQPEVTLLGLQKLSDLYSKIV
jgi:thiol-disulfide isomerase/thioredoxin